MEPAYALSRSRLIAFFIDGEIATSDYMKPSNGWILSCCFSGDSFLGSLHIDGNVTR